MYKKGKEEFYEGHAEEPWAKYSLSGHIFSTRHTKALRHI